MRGYRLLILLKYIWRIEGRLISCKNVDFCISKLNKSQSVFVVTSLLVSRIRFLFICEMILFKCWSELTFDNVIFKRNTSAISWIVLFGYTDIFRKKIFIDIRSLQTFPRKRENLKRIFYKIKKRPSKNFLTTTKHCRAEGSWMLEKSRKSEEKENFQFFEDSWLKMFKKSENNP